MTTEDEQAFLAAIVAAPEDDTPRLVFADWLDERGRDDDAARAALIRAQCRLEHLPPGRERAALEKQARAVLRAHAKRWAAPLSQLRLGEKWTYRRGFLDGVTMSPTHFVRHAETIFRFAPTLRTVRFPYAQGEVTELAACPFLARLASVDLTEMCTCGMCPIDVELRNLFKSKHAAGLNHLSVSLDRIDADMVRALVASKHLGQLTSLDLSGNPLGPDGARVLAEAKHLTRLAALNLTNTGLFYVGVAALASATHFPALGRLNLSQNGVRAAGVRALVAAPFFGRLVALDLSGNRIGEGGVAALAKVPASAKLAALDVSGNHLSEKAIKALKVRFGKGAKFE